MEIVLNQEPVIPEHSPEIVSAIWGVSQHVGLTQEDGEDVAIRGNAVDLYLLAAVIAQRLAVGDLELVEKGDTRKERLSGKANSGNKAGLVLKES